MASLAGFYARTSQSEINTGFIINVKLNSEHEVYQGHFPGKPVAPGAALTQMVLDEVSVLTNNRPIIDLRQIKFLAVIDPKQVTELELLIEMKERNGVEMFTCVGRTGETNYFKLNGIFG